MAWEVEYHNGIWLPQVGWWLDAHFPVDRSFVSHAHFDHIAAHREILCSPGTARLMRARLPLERADAPSRWQRRLASLDDALDLGKAAARHKQHVSRLEDGIVFQVLGGTDGVRPHRDIASIS